MKRLTVTLLALTLLAASAEADVTIKMSRTDLTEEKPTPQSGTTLLTGNKMASIWAPLEGRKDAGDDSHLIYRGDKQTIWVIKDSDKSYMEMTKASIDAMGQKLDGAMAQMKAELEKMPPEQRKMMEEMMAKQGVAMGGGGAAPGAIRYCVSKEQAERGDVPQDADGRCKRDSMERSGSTMRFKFSCTNPPSSGTGEITLSGDKAYAMKMVVDSTVQGKPQRMEMQQNGRWVSADCGTLKPRQ